MGLLGGGSSKQSSASSISGVGTFAPKNNININEPIVNFDLKNPFELVAIALICAAGWYAWRKFK